MKNYIGSGKKHEKFDGIVTVNIDLEKAKPFIYDFKGKNYLRFDVSEMRQANEYGKTHTVSVWTPDSQESATPQKSTTPTRSLDDEIPF